MKITAELIRKLRDETSAGILDCKKALTASEGDIQKAIVWLREQGVVKAAKKSSREAKEGIVNTFVESNKGFIFKVNTETDFVARNSNFLKLIEQIKNYLKLAKNDNIDEILKIKIDNVSLDELIVNNIAIIGEKISLTEVKILIKNDDQIFGLYNHANNGLSTLLVFEGNANEEALKQISMHTAAMNPQFISIDKIPEDFVAKEKSIIVSQMEKDSKNAQKPKNIIEKMLIGKLNKVLGEICLESQVFVLDNKIKVKDFLKQNNLKIIKMTRLSLKI